MVLAVIRVEDLPENPLDAAARFHAAVVPRARAALAEGRDLALLFPPGDKAQHGWRHAAIQGLAREAAPRRVNGVESGGDDAAVAEVTDWLANAQGVTGQLFQVDGKTAAMV